MIRTTMRTHPPTLLLRMVAAIALVVAACGGGSSADATPAPAAAPTELDSFRFTATATIDMTGDPAAGGAPQFGMPSAMSFSATGAVVSPDRSQATIEADMGFMQFNMETITIGNQSWTREPGGQWTEGTGLDMFGMGDLEAFGVDLEAMTEEEEAQATAETEEALERFERLRERLDSTRESVNGRNAIRYDLTRADLEELAQDPEFADLFEGIEELGDAELNMSFWLDLETGVPLKLTLATTIAEDGMEATVDVEMNLTDINSDIEIEPPI